MFFFNFKMTFFWFKLHQYIETPKKNCYHDITIMKMFFPNCQRNLQLYLDYLHKQYRLFQVERLFHCRQVEELV